MISKQKQIHINDILDKIYQETKIGKKVLLIGNTRTFAVRIPKMVAKEFPVGADVVYCGFTNKDLKIIDSILIKRGHYMIFGSYRYGHIEVRWREC